MKNLPRYWAITNLEGDKADIISDFVYKEYSSKWSINSKNDIIGHNGNSFYINGTFCEESFSTINDLKNSSPVTPLTYEELTTTEEFQNFLDLNGLSLPDDEEDSLYNNQIIVITDDSIEGYPAGTMGKVLDENYDGALRIDFPKKPKNDKGIIWLMNDCVRLATPKEADFFGDIYHIDDILKLDTYKFYKKVGVKRYYFKSRTSLCRIDPFNEDVGTNPNLLVKLKPIEKAQALEYLYETALKKYKNKNFNCLMGESPFRGDITEYPIKNFEYDTSLWFTPSKGIAIQLFNRNDGWAKPLKKVENVSHKFNEGDLIRVTEWRYNKSIPTDLTKDILIKLGGKYWDKYKDGVNNFKHLPFINKRKPDGDAYSDLKGCLWRHATEDEIAVYNKEDESNISTSYNFNLGDLVIVTKFGGKNDWNRHWFKPGEILKLGGKFWDNKSLKGINEFKEFAAISEKSPKGNGMNSQSGFEFRLATTREIDYFNKVGYGANINDMDKKLTPKSNVKFEVDKYYKEPFGDIMVKCLKTHPNFDIITEGFGVPLISHFDESSFEPPDKRMEWGELDNEQIRECLIKQATIRYKDKYIKSLYEEEQGIYKFDPSQINNYVSHVDSLNYRVGNNLITIYKNCKWTEALTSCSTEIKDPVLEDLSDKIDSIEDPIYDKQPLLSGDEIEFDVETKGNDGRGSIYMVIKHPKKIIESQEISMLKVKER